MFRSAFPGTFLGAFLGAFAALAAPTRADVLSLTAVRDTTLWNDATGSIANGSGPVMIVGRAGGASTAPIRRGLVRFDIAALVPAGSVVNSVQLVLANPNGNTGPRNVRVHRVLNDWGEGASSTSSGQGAPAQALDATWLHRFYPSQNWTTAGGDFATSASTVLAVDQLGTHTWPSTAAAVADVQGWLDTPGGNFGWLLKLDVESVSQTTKVFGTRESSDPTEWPTLIVDFTPPLVGTYCAARATGNGCLPDLGWSGTPSASSASGFVVSLTQAPALRATSLVYTLAGPASTPFLGGTLCLATPLTRSAVQVTAGSGPAGCGASASLDFNARIAAGLDARLVAGAVVHAQWHLRDPLNPAGSFAASDALRFALLP
ncbi:MAG: DNRLRE domain-containing protein [Planctomycetes bacterium]|nr:DNRLRE domain-containing protein [Planctomycetota bacterium]